MLLNRKFKKKRIKRNKDGLRDTSGTISCALTLISKINDNVITLKAAREKQQAAHKGTSKGYPLIILQQKFCRSEDSATIYLRLWDTKAYNQIYSTKYILFKSLLQISWKGKNIYSQAKDKIVQHHQSSFITNVKGTLPCKKKKRPQLET